MVESSNKSLVNIIKKLLDINIKSWHKKLVNALWADQVSQKKSIGMSPFELVYGVDTVFLLHLLFQWSSFFLKLVVKKAICRKG